MGGVGLWPPCRLMAAAVLLCLPAAVGRTFVAWTEKQSNAATNLGPSGGRASMAFAQQSIGQSIGGAPLSDVLWMFGGISDTAPLNYSRELWGYTASTGQWQSVALQGSTPPPLVGASMCVLGNSLYVFGGANFDSAAYSDIYSYSTASSQWSLMNIAGFAPTARAYHAMACTAYVSPSKIFVFGGETASGTLLSDTVQLTDPTGTGVAWSLPPVTGSIPSARRSHTLTHSNGKLYLFGGSGTSGTKMSDCYRLDVSTLVWTSLATSGDVPTGRDGHTATILDEKLYIFGGADNSGRLNDVRILDLASLRWKHARAAGGLNPAPRWGHVGALINQQFYTYGGLSGTSALLSDVWHMSRHCAGRVTLSDSRGSFSSGDGNYLSSTSCEWLLTPGTLTNRQMRLYFTAFGLEAGKDYVSVYDGPTAAADRLLAKLTGASLPLPIISSINATLLVQLSTDQAGNDYGFDAAYFAECAAGFYPSSSAVQGNDECAPCAPGHFTSAAGLPSCTQCPTHQYQDLSGQSACKDCPSASRAEFVGAASTKECLCYEGFHSPAGQGTDCVACPVGGTCPGGAIWKAIAQPGYCAFNASFMAPCCNPADCPGGRGRVAKCPERPIGAFGEPGAAECVPFQILTLSFFDQFLPVAGVVVGVALFCFLVGHVRGRRMGAVWALQAYAKKLRVTATMPQIGSYTEALAAGDGAPERSAPMAASATSRVRLWSGSSARGGGRARTGSSTSALLGAGARLQGEQSRACSGLDVDRPSSVGSRGSAGEEASLALVDLEGVHSEEARLVPSSPNGSSLVSARKKTIALDGGGRGGSSSPRGPPVMHLQALQDDEALLLDPSELDPSESGGSAGSARENLAIPAPPTPMRRAPRMAAPEAGNPAADGSEPPSEQQSPDLAERRGMSEKPNVQVPGGGTYVGTCLVQMPDAEGRWQPVQISASMQGSPVGSQHPSLAGQSESSTVVGANGALIGGCISPARSHPAHQRFKGPSSVRSGAFEDLEEEDSRSN